MVLFDVQMYVTDEGQDTAHLLAFHVVVDEEANSVEVSSEGKGGRAAYLDILVALQAMERHVQGVVQREFLAELQFKEDHGLLAAWLAELIEEAPISSPSDEGDEPPF